jgi:hypothetical protein
MAVVAPRPLPELLNDIFEPFRASSAALADRCAAFVSDGKDAAVLAEFTKLGPTGAHVLGAHLQRDRASGAARAALCAQAGGVAPAVLMRLAKVLNAIEPHGQSSGWPDTLLRSAATAMNYVPGTGFAVRGAIPFGIPVLVAAMAEDELTPETLIAGTFSPEPQWGGMQRTIAAMDGFVPLLEQHPAAAREALARKDVAARVHALTIIGTFPVPTRLLFADEIAQHASSTARQVRAAAMPAVAGMEAVIAPRLRERIVNTSPDERIQAVTTLWEITAQGERDELRAFLTERAKFDTARGVRTTIEKLLADDDRRGNVQELPEFPAAAPPPPLSEATRKAFDAMFVRDTPGLKDGDPEALWEYITGARDAFPTLPPGSINRDIARFTSAPDIRVQHIIRLSKASQVWQDTRGMLDIRLVIWLVGQRVHTPDLSLLQLEAMGLDPKTIARTYLFKRVFYAGNWPPEAVWPFFARHVDLLIERDKTTSDAGVVYGVVAMFPELPPWLVDRLFERALGADKAERPLAQAALARVPDKVTRIAAALKSTKAETRTIAAAWLGDVRDPAAEVPLEAALKTEKNEAASSAMMTALARLGVPSERYVRLDSLLADARKALAKGMPGDLAWLPAELPTVRWATSGAAINADILRSFILQAYKLKSPEPGGGLQAYAAMFDPSDRERFGDVVLDGWIAADVVPISRDLAQNKARSTAQWTYRLYQHNIKNNTGAALGALGNKSEDELYQHFLPLALAEPAGSATASKGVLAIAAACCSGSCVPRVERYLKRWYGWRPAQGRALIGMLAWIEDDAAIQLLLSIATRFRTKSFQEEALRNVQLVADRKGWTLDQLADRTVPTGGFGDDGTMTLSFGERSFVAKLDDALSIVLVDPEGHALAALPAPRKDDDAAAAAEGKTALANAKKQLKTIVAQQTERLYEGMCVGRSWTFPEWQSYLNRHPVVRRLCERLVWRHMLGDATTTFRPLSDGSLTTAGDEPFAGDPVAIVTLAHAATLDDAEAAAWQRHLKDYAVAPLFGQLGRDVFAIPDEHRSDTELADYQGHMIDSFALRGRATKLGWLRGPAGDGGVFSVYEKRFPSLGLVAQLEFSGAQLPESRQTVALHTLSFRSAGEDHGSRTALGDVPPILLSECWNDVRTIAADGTGFDPQWQSKT